MDENRQDVQGKSRLRTDVHRQIAANGCDSHDIPPSGELMKRPAPPSWHRCAISRNSQDARLAWDGSNHLLENPDVLAT